MSHFPLVPDILLSYCGCGCGDIFVLINVPLPVAIKAHCNTQQFTEFNVN